MTTPFRWFVFAALLAFVSCRAGEGRVPDAAGAAVPKPVPVAADRVRLEETIRRAMEWMTTLDVDPIRLRREKGMKGIKHMVEYVNFHQLVYRGSADPETRKTARGRALDLLRVTDDDGYHNLASVDARRFRQDSMSYLRACWLAENLGKDTTRYRSEIDKVLPLIHAHLPTRGVDQRMGFALLFEQLGLDRPETVEQIYPDSLIARRAPLSYFQVSLDRPYDITHEIFALTARGTRAFPPSHPSGEIYAKTTVNALLKHSINGGNLDLACEFLVNLVELQEGTSAIAEETREFIFAAQNTNGSFGDYRKQAVVLTRRNPRYDVLIGGNLHTTMVCVWGLIEMTPDSLHPARDS